jgi:hypothetical protein
MVETQICLRKKGSQGSEVVQGMVVGSIPTAPTKTSLILLSFHTCTSQNRLIQA